VNHPLSRGPLGRGQGVGEAAAAIQRPGLPPCKGPSCVADSGYLEPVPCLLDLSGQLWFPGGRLSRPGRLSNRATLPASSVLLTRFEPNLQHQRFPPRA
jgi:hypothetical protein